MSGKNQFPKELNWQSTSPITGFLPLNNNTQGSGSVPSGVVTGTMSGTNTIYSQIVDVSRIDNSGLEINWTGNPVGTISFQGSVSGVNFYAVTDFNETLLQPAGSASGYLLNLNQWPWKYIMVQYTNTSGAGILTIFAQQKDLN